MYILFSSHKRCLLSVCMPSCAVFFFSKAKRGKKLPRIWCCVQSNSCTFMTRESLLGLHFYDLKSYHVNNIMRIMGLKSGKTSAVFLYTEYSRRTDEVTFSGSLSSSGSVVHRSLGYNENVALPATLQPPKPITCITQLILVS